MLDFCNAKINLGLNIVGKRGDGYHYIETVFYPIGLSDILEIIVIEANGIEIECSGLSIPAGSNLIEKAYNLIKKDYDLPGIKAHLHKIIPIGAGLGGGSSDAAHFIKLIDKKLEMNLSWGEQHHYARQLGSDCSFFISNRPAYAEGRGDQYESINISLRGYFLVLINPGIFISTAEAYKGVIPTKPSVSIEDNILEYPVGEWRNLIYNDFEKHIFQIYPEIKTIRDQLYHEGAVYASMSGSGSSIYGIFKEKPDLKDVFRDYFVWQEEL